VTHTEAELARAVAVRAFTELLHDALQDPRMHARVETFASSLLLATTAHDAQPNAEVIAIEKR
jgi:hypothetical protein